jgi:hypothetical protein
MNPTIQINGYTAKILSQRKLISFYHADGWHKLEVPVGKRVTKKAVEAYISGFNGVKTVWVRHERYCAYDLRNVMKQRTGSYTHWTDYSIEDGKIVNSSKSLENGMY